MSTVVPFPLLRLSHIWASYDQRCVLEDINMELPTTGLLGISGPNGGGKTTLIKLILGLHKPDSGQITYYTDGRPCDRLRMGYLPQQHLSDRRFPISVLEVVLSGLLGHRRILGRYSRADRQIALDMLSDVGMADYAQVPIGQLSGGQRQRALLGRALMCQPELLLLDEPTTYFDVQAREWLLNKMKELSRQCMVVMVSHEKQDLQALTSHIIEINHRLRTINIDL